MVISSFFPVYTAIAEGWHFEVNGGETAYQTFHVDRSKREITFKISVKSGGPISFYVLNETAFNIWQGNNIVTAYVGAYNVTEGQTVYATGRLGDAGTYYAIIDNRFIAQSAIVEVSIIQRAPFPSIFIIALSFIPLILLTLKRRTLQSQ